MDYFNNVLTTFLDLDCVRILAVYGRVKELERERICVPKINKALTKGEQLMTDFSFLGELSR